MAEEAGVALSINLTGGVFVNQSAAFSDYHGTGANPPANAALTDAASWRAASASSSIGSTWPSGEQAWATTRFSSRSEAGIARLTLNRPERINSFNDAMHAEVRDALDAVESDARCACCS